MDCFVALLPCANASRLSQAMTKRIRDSQSMDTASIVVLSGLVIGLVYGSGGLLSGFCLMSGLRGWWADGDGRLVRTHALALGGGGATAGIVGAGRPPRDRQLMLFA